MFAKGEEQNQKDTAAVSLSRCSTGRFAFECIAHFMKGLLHLNTLGHIQTDRHTTVADRPCRRWQAKASRRDYFSPVCENSTRLPYCGAIRTSDIDGNNIWESTWPLFTIGLVGYRPFYITKSRCEKAQRWTNNICYMYFYLFVSCV